MQTTKRSYTGLADYASAHHAPRKPFLDAGWTEGHVRRGRSALMFPTRSGNRYRFIDDAKPTYDHDKGYKPCWYGLELAVKMSSPIVDCNGAPSTIVAQYFGIPAFSLQSGEGAALTPELIAQVQAIYHGAIVVGYDCDEAGRRAAIRRVRDWRKAGFESWAIDLALGFDGADLADFAATGELISECKQIEIPVEVAKAITRHAFSNQTEDDLLRKVELALDALSGPRCDDVFDWVKVGMAVKEGLGDAGLPLWEAWSTHSDKFKPGECEVRWKTFNRHDLGIGSLFKWADEDSGRSWRDQLRRTNSTFARNCTTPEKTQGVVENTTPLSPGQSDSIRTAQLAYAHPSIAPVMEVWTEAIDRGLLKSGDPIDVKYLTCVSETLGRAVSERTIRQGLNQGVEHFFAKVSYINSTKKEEPITPNRYKGTTTSNPCARPGRKAQCYILLPKRETLHNLAALSVAPILRKAFPAGDHTLAPVCEDFLKALGLESDEAKASAAELDKRYGALIASQSGYGQAIARARAEYARLVRSFTDERSTPLLGEFANHAGYVACFARSTVIAAGGQTQFARSTWAARLGVKDRALPTVFRRAGIHVEKDVYAKVLIASLVQLRAVRAEYDGERRGYPSKLQSSLKKTLMPFDVGGPMLAWLETELRLGAAVELLFRQANRQTLIPAEPAAAPKRLLWGLIEGARRLIGWALAKLQTAGEPQQIPLIEATFSPRFFRQSVLARWMKTWAFPAESESETRQHFEREQYEAGWLRRLFEQAVPLNRIANLDGELAPYSVQLAFMELLGPAPPMAVA